QGFWWCREGKAAEDMGGNMRLSVECDGGSRGNPGPAGTGSSVKDAAGVEVGCVWQFIKHATNNVAEYQGLINGLNLAVEIAEQQGVKPESLSVDVRMDSKLVVEQMSGRWKIKHPDMKPLAQEVKRIEGKLAQVSYTWVPRAQNARADELANRAMDDREGGQWIDEELAAARSAAVASPAEDAEGADMLFDLDQPSEEATDTTRNNSAQRAEQPVEYEDEDSQPAGSHPPRGWASPSRRPCFCCATARPNSPARASTPAAVTRSSPTWARSRSRTPPATSASAATSTSS